jgi:hypothetical protein
MTPDTVFSIGNLVALSAWIVLAIAPRRRWTHLVVAMVPMLLSGVYVVIIAAAWKGSQGGFSSLTEVSTLFANPWLLLAGWIHYLAFDLLVGAWEVRDASSHGIGHAIVLPCLVVTFLFGPAGWLLYMAVRSAKGENRAPALHGPPER